MTSGLRQDVTRFLNFIGDFNFWTYSSRISDLRFGLLSDLIHVITENGLRHASGPVHAKHPIRYIDNNIKSKSLNNPFI